MGKVNTVMCDFLGKKRRFADLFNGIFFKGREVIQPAQLQAASEQYPIVDDEISHRFRDIKMYLHTGEALRVLAVENQNKIDYTLPYRCMHYDALEYGRQLKELQEYNKENHLLNTSAEWLSGVTAKDRLAPVYTLCLYHGEEPWNGPNSLKDMMDFGDDRDCMSSFFADYPMRLFCINEHTDFSCFHTEIKEVFTALAYRRDKIQLCAAINESASFRKLSSDVVKVLSVLLNTPKLWAERKKFMNDEKEEEYDMCQAIRELYEDGKNEGISLGITQGMEMMNLLIQKLLAGKRMEDLAKATEDPAFREQLFAEYHIRP